MLLSTQAEITTRRQTLKHSHRKPDLVDNSTPFNQHLRLAHHRPSNQLSPQKTKLDESTSGPTTCGPINLVNPPFSAATINSSNGPTSSTKPKRKQKERED